MEQGIRKTVPSFQWEVTTNHEEFVSSFGAFKVIAWDPVSAPQIDNVDLRWPAPSTFLKNQKAKETIWQSVQNIVLPAMNKSTAELAPLNVTPAELQKILRFICESDKPYTLVASDGRIIGVNTTENVDLKLTSNDIASAFAATHLFGAKSVQFK